MPSIKYQFKSHIQPTVAPLTAAVGMALSASTLQAAVITVDTLADGSVPGQCTLRDAMQAAYTDAPVAGCAAGSGPDQIQFESGLSGTITLTGGTIENLSDVTISGPGPNLLTISGNNTGRIFASNAPLSIDGLTLTGGATNEFHGGSAILSLNAPLNLSDCEIIDNYSGTASYGGAVTVGDTQATVDSCLFDNNQVVGGVFRGGGGNPAYGGAILAVNSLLLVNSSTFSNNQSGYQGGAIALVGSYSDILSSTFSNNDALFGGAISAAGSSAAYLAESLLTFNEAGAGGAIVAGSLSGIQLYQTDIDSNIALVYGGGIQIGVGTAPTPIGTSSNFGNAISRGVNFSLAGPGQLEGLASQISNNLSEYYGGGLVAKYDSQVELTASSVIGNSALPPLPLSSDVRYELSVNPLTAGYLSGGGSSNQGSGGGMLARGGAVIYGIDLQLADNQAYFGGGGGMADQQGALYLIESTIENNSAFVGGGLLAGSIDTSTPLSASASPAPASLRGGGGGDGGTVVTYGSLISSNTADYLGGGLSSIFDGVALAKYSTIEANQAQSGGGAGSYQGGLGIAGSEVRANIAASIGGGVTGEADCQMIVIGSTISSNTAGTAGGLASLNCGAVTKYSTVSDNSATAIGGMAGLAYGMNTVSILNSTITGNTANQIGGLYGVDIELDFVTLSHNTATGAPPPLGRDRSQLAGGLSVNPGGAYIEAAVGTAALSNSIFANNTNPDTNVDLTVNINLGAATLDYSLVQMPGSGLPAGSGNLLGADPQLGPLVDNGGLTWTRALPEASPAVDTGDPATTVSYDQRNDPFPRVFGGRADMGAFEFVIDGIFSDRFEQP